MKKIIILVSAALMAVTSLKAEGLNITAGYAMGLDKYTEANGQKSNKFSNGFYIGIGYTIRDVISDNWNIDTGLQYVNFWGKKNDECKFLDGSKIKGQQVDSYIQLPVRLNYTWDTENCDFFLYAGPKFLFGLKSQFRSDDVPGPINWYAKELEHAYKRFNLMLGVGGGVYIGEHLRIDVGYDWGVLNRYKGDYKDEGHKLYESMLNVGVAFCF